MISGVKNLLYKDAALYELAYPDDDDRLADRCLDRLSILGSGRIETVLDVGCGTGRVLGGLARRCRAVVGIDLNPVMIEAASRRNPGWPVQVADMRSVRLDRTFDAILMLGNVLTYVQSNEDLRRTIETLVAHAHGGTTVMLSMFNPFRLLALKSAGIEQKFQFVANGSEYVGTAKFELDPRRQRIIRRRQWMIDGLVAEDDYCSYRMFFPEELEFLFRSAGFKVLSISDDIDGNDSNFLDSQQLFLIARR